MPCYHAEDFIYQGVTYREFCDQPGKLYPNGEWCDGHARATPTPDPNLTAAALQAGGRQTFPNPPAYGQPEVPAELVIRTPGVRVLKAHRQAVVDALPTMAAVINAIGVEGFAELLAADVLCATDDRVRFVVGVREASGAALVYGPYATHAAATKALETGLIPVLSEGASGAVLPISPAPRAGKKPTTPKKVASLTEKE